MYFYKYPKDFKPFIISSCITFTVIEFPINIFSTMIR